MGATQQAVLAAMDSAPLLPGTAVLADAALAGTAPIAFPLPGFLARLPGCCRAIVGAAGAGRGQGVSHGQRPRDAGSL